MSPEAHERLVDLDAVSREARAFYGQAAARLPASSLRECCLRLETAKAELVALLAIRLRGGPGVAGSRAAAPLREQLAPAFLRARRELVRAPPNCRESMAWIEATVVDACRRAASGSADADCRRVMAWALPMLQRCHDELRPGARPT